VTITVGNPRKEKFPEQGLASDMEVHFRERSQPAGTREEHLWKVPLLKHTVYAIIS
jgi:hypothetical protein